MHFITTPAELCNDIFGKKFCVAACHIDIHVFPSHQAIQNGLKISEKLHLVQQHIVLILVVNSFVQIRKEYFRIPILFILIGIKSHLYNMIVRNLITLVFNASCDIFADSAFLSILYELTFCTTCKRNAKIGSSLRLILKKECIFAHLTYAFLTFDQYHTCYFCHDIWIRKLICCFHPFPPIPVLCRFFCTVF